MQFLLVTISILNNFYTDCFLLPNVEDKVSISSNLLRDNFEENPLNRC